MSKKFEASNNVIVFRNSRGYLMTSNWMYTDAIGTEDEQAIREFFAAHPESD